MRENTDILRGWYNQSSGKGLQSKWLTIGQTEINKNERTHGEFEVVGWVRGRSSIQVFIKKTGTDEVYPMFMKDFFDTFCMGQRKNLTIGPVKRGSNIAWSPVQ